MLGLPGGLSELGKRLYPGQLHGSSWGCSPRAGYYPAPACLPPAAQIMDVHAQQPGRWALIIVVAPSKTMSGSSSMQAPTSAFENLLLYTVISQCLKTLLGQRDLSTIVCQHLLPSKDEQAIVATQSLDKRLSCQCIKIQLYTN